MNKGLKVVLIILAVILALALIAGAVLFIMYQTGKKSLKNEAENIKITAPDELKEAVRTEEDGAVVYYNGEKYKYNENAIPILIMGVDKYDFDDTEGIGYNGQADAVYIAVLDTETKKVSLLSVSRDTMVDVDMYSHDNNFLRSEKKQLCLAYAYGDGKEKSCENVAASVSRILCNIPMNTYAALNFDSIPVINDSVDGVTVPEYDDLGFEKTGQTVTLNGEAARRYLRWRYTGVTDSNQSRIERQKNYISAFTKKAVEYTKKDISYPVNTYNAISKYMVTNIGASQVTYIAANYLDGVENMKMYSIPGKIEKIDGYAQFRPDQTALFETVLELFYYRVVK